MTIKKTARAMSVALLLVVAGLVVYGIRVIPALKSGVGNTDAGAGGRAVDCRDFHRRAAAGADG